MLFIKIHEIDVIYRLNARSIISRTWHVVVGGCDGGRCGGGYAGHGGGRGHHGCGCHVGDQVHTRFMDLDNY